MDAFIQRQRRQADRLSHSRRLHGGKTRRQSRRRVGFRQSRFRRKRIDSVQRPRPFVKAGLPLESASVGPHTGNAVRLERARLLAHGIAERRRLERCAMDRPAWHRLASQNRSQRLPQRLRPNGRHRPVGSNRPSETNAHRFHKALSDMSFRLFTQDSGLPLPCPLSP